MKDRASRRAEREARREMSAHPQRPAKHEEDVRRYLGSEFYVEQKAHHEEPDEHEKRSDRR